jgi:hypothetical protein
MQRIVEAAGKRSPDTGDLIVQISWMRSVAIGRA